MPRRPPLHVGHSIHTHRLLLIAITLSFRSSDSIARAFHASFRLYLRAYVYDA